MTSPSDEPTSVGTEGKSTTSARGAAPAQITGERYQGDAEGDLRGIALRVVVSDDEAHDLLMTNFPVPHARDAKQFVAFARAMSGNRILGIVKLVFAVGPVQALRKLRDVVRDSKRPVSQGKN